MTEDDEPRVQLPTRFYDAMPMPRGRSGLHAIFFATVHRAQIPREEFDQARACFRVPWVLLAAPPLAFFGAISLLKRTLWTRPNQVRLRFGVGCVAGFVANEIGQAYYFRSMDRTLQAMPDASLIKQNFLITEYKRHRPEKSTLQYGDVKEESDEVGEGPWVTPLFKALLLKDATGPAPRMVPPKPTLSARLARMESELQGETSQLTQRALQAQMRQLSLDVENSSDDAVREQWARVQRLWSDRPSRPTPTHRIKATESSAKPPVEEWGASDADFTFDPYNPKEAQAGAEGAAVMRDVVGATTEPKTTWQKIRENK